jgi:hypothetical protein
MRKRGAFRTWLGIVSVALLAAGPGARAGGDAGGGSAPPPENALGALGSLGLPLDELLGQALAVPGQLAGPDLLKVAGPVRVLLIGSGIDGATFGDTYAERLTVHGGGDPVGLGTYAASVLFQVAPEAHLTSVNVYEGDHVHRGRLIQALELARDHAGDLDAVAFAFPPSEVLDPMAAGLASERWDVLSDVGGGQLRQLAENWARLRELVAELGANGLTVVAPAGDLGPAPQSLLGVAGLPEVVTVGAHDGAGIAATSASGPSVHGGAKPDLVAPVGLPGLVPEESKLAAILPAGGPAIDRNDLDLPFPPAGGRPAFIGSTIPAAVGVAATVAQLRVDGVTDAPAVRGVLAAAAVPEPGVPAWRQGAGVLREAPSAALARSRPLIGGPLHLGAEPLAGRAWEAAAAVTGGQVAGTPTVAFPWRVETAPDGTRRAVDVPDGDARPAPVVSAASDVVRIALTPGDNPWAPGAWCGYLHVPLAGPGGGAELLEDLPLCLVEGLTLTAFNAYIHDVPAEDLTFALIPALPPGVSLLSGPLAVLPLDPLHEPVLAGVSGTDGMVRFANVPPAFYVMRQFSDYGAPLVEVFDGAGQTRARDVGEAATYLGYDALVLPNPCAEKVQDHMETGTDCHRAALEERFGPAEYDPSTARYLVDTPAGRMGVVFDFAKKVAGVGVSSRYVDLLAHDALTHGSAVSLDEVLGPLPERLGLELSDAWTFSGADVLGDPEGTLATYKGLDLEHDPASVAGTSTYPFALATPNYQGTMSLDFRYDIDDAILGVIVQVAGKGPHVTVLTPQGKIEVPHVDPAKPVAVTLREAALNAQQQSRPRDGEQPGPPPQLDPKRLFGAATGQVGLRLDLQPGGASEGTLTFVYVPLEPARPASIHVGDLSFEVTTWQRIDWPRAHLPRDGRMVMGHNFFFDSHYRATQMDHPACRRLADGGLSAEVCENWQVFVHSPLDDAETFELVDTASGRGFMGDVRTGGGGLFNPHRGVHGDREEFAVAGVGLPIGRGVITNGRFWEQLVVPAATLAAHPGEVEVRIEDNQVGRGSGLLVHADGPVPLAPYVGFTAWHRHVEAGLLDDLGVAPSRR